MRLRAMGAVYTITHRKSMLKIKVLPDMKCLLPERAELVMECEGNGRCDEPCR